MNATHMIEHLCREALARGGDYPEMLLAVLIYFMPREPNPEDMYDGAPGLGEGTEALPAYYDVISVLSAEPDFVPAARRGIELLNAKAG